MFAAKVAAFKQQELSICGNNRQNSFLLGVIQVGPSRLQSHLQPREEKEILLLANNLKKNSRLACQIKISEKLENLVFKIA